MATARCLLCFALKKVAQGFVGDRIEEHHGGDENDYWDDGFHMIKFFKGFPGKRPEVLLVKE
jgi:hypothetical protein